MFSIHENMNSIQIIWVTVTCKKKSQIALTVYENIFSKSFTILIFWKCFLNELNSRKIAMKNSGAKSLLSVEWEWT